MARGLSWRRWIVAHLVGSVLGIVLGTALGAVTLSAGLGAGVGLGVGLAQWLTLRRTVIGDSSRDWRWPAVGWVGASAGAALLPGWLLVFAVILGASGGGIPPADVDTFIASVAGVGALFGGVPGVALGIVAGGVQTLILRLIWPGLPVRYGLGWLAATAVGWGFSWALEGIGAGLIATATSAEGVATPVLVAVGILLVLGCWTVTGALTGLVLARLNGWAATASPVPPASPAGEPTVAV